MGGIVSIGSAIEKNGLSQTEAYTYYNVTESLLQWGR